MIYYCSILRFPWLFNVWIKTSLKWSSRAGLFNARLSWDRIGVNFDFRFVAVRWHFMFILLVFLFWVWKISNYAKQHRKIFAIGEKFIFWLTFNPEFALTGIPTTQPWSRDPIENKNLGSAQLQKRVNSKLEPTIRSNKCVINQGCMSLLAYYSAISI